MSAVGSILTSLEREEQYELSEKRMRQIAQKKAAT
ncbi:hypothetical protein DSM3645_17946 [Blastopirellula marina DSM 3645]|uniref:Uncharacterized protein n=1 Tax=Blastopirellula marina DSM 3645 TaxID=314230 RepID=A4A2W3_9BACT|nr:hypothetical protein DSM3645_17946 [Blastopirellula marina DSM 3645]